MTIEPKRPSGPSEKPAKPRDPPDSLPAEKPGRRPYPVNDPDFASPDRPGSEPDVLPGTRPPDSLPEM